MANLSIYSVFFRRKASSRTRGPENTRGPTRSSKASRESNDRKSAVPVLVFLMVLIINYHLPQFSFNKLHMQLYKEYNLKNQSLILISLQETRVNSQVVHKDKSMKLNPLSQEDGHNARLCHELLKPAIKPPEEETLHTKHPSQGDLPFSGPLHVTSSSGFAWATKWKEENASLRSHSRSSSRGMGPGALDASSILLSGRVTSDSRRQVNGDILHDCVNSNSKGSFDMAKRAMLKQWSQFERPDSFDASDVYHSQELAALYRKDELLSKRNIRVWFCFYTNFISILLFIGFGIFILYQKE